jgi:hypothetical protein
MTPRLFFLGRGDYGKKGHGLEKPSWFRVPVKVLSVPWKLMVLEEDR